MSIFQDDSLSVMFILTVNNLSFMLRKIEGYFTGEVISQGKRNTKSQFLC